MKDLKISLMGMGYVGLITGMAFAKHDFQTVVTDSIPERVELLAKGKPPFYEPNLNELIQEEVERGMLKGGTDNIAAVTDTDVTFICVGTPSGDDGSIDLSYVKTVARDIGKALKEIDRYHVVVTKSTIVPTTSPWCWMTSSSCPGMERIWDSTCRYSSGVELRLRSTSLEVMVKSRYSSMIRGMSSSPACLMFVISMRRLRKTRPA